MGKWQTKFLKDLTLQITDGKHGDCQNQSNSGYFFISCKDIYDGKINYDNARQITPDDYWDTHRRTRLEVNDILITNSGTIGRMAFINAPELCTKTTFQKSVAIVKPDTKKIYPKYLYYLLQNLVGDLINSSNGSAQKNLLLSTMRSFSIRYLEDIKEQQKIADILSAYDDLIENNRKQIKLLEEAAQRLYKEWFIDLRFPGYETTHIVNGVPDGWKKVQLRELIAFNPKIAVTIDTIKTFVPMEALSTSSMVISASEVFETSKNAGSKFGIGDTLLARITPCLENGKTAFVSNIDKGGYGVGSTEFIVLRSEKLNPYIVYLLARTKEFRSYAINSMTGSDGRQRVKVDKLEKYPTLLPSRKVIDLFGRIVAPYFGKVKVLSKAIHSCQEARNYLLPKLMTGELEVK